jgi:hypothetical protein
VKPMNPNARWTPICLRMRSSGLVFVASLAIALAACGGDSPSASVSASASGTDAPVGDGPPGCLEAQFAFDSETSRLLLLNCVGQEGTGSTTEQVWSWDGTAWSLVADDGPPAMLVTGVTYDTDRHVMVRYGGQPLTSSDCVPETWEWDGATWGEVEASPPTACDHALMVYDAARGVTTLFGGGDANQDLVAETWNWDGSSWTPVAGADEGPSGRAHFGFVYDATHDQSLLFGGYNGDAVFGDFWSWDGAAWTELDFPGPSARSHFSMAVSPEGLLLFGGSTGPSTMETINDETWSLTDGRWSQLQVDGPQGRGMAAMGYDPARDVFVLFGGFDADHVLADTWEFDGERWRCVLGCEE